MIDTVPRAHAATLLAAALALVLACLLTASRVPFFDPDEGYYPATAAESVRSGTGWDLRFNGEPRWDKPPLSYVAIELAFGAFGAEPWAARLPSAIQGAALVILAGLLVGYLAGSRAGALSGAVVASTLGVQIFARAAHPEIAVVLAIVTAELLIASWIAYPEQRSPWFAVLIGVAFGYGVLAKGPVAVALPALMVLAALPWLPRPWPRLSEIAGAVAIAGLTAAVIAVPWYVAMTFRHGFEFLRTAVWSQNVTRYTSGVFGHRAPIVFFILPTIIGLLPWTGLLPAALASMRGRARSPRQTLRVCMAASALSAFAFYSLASSKLASYALVFLPPLGILVALYLDEELDRREPRAAALRAGATVLALCGIALIVMPLLVGSVIQPREILGGVPARDAGFDRSVLWPAVLPAGAALLAAAVILVIARSRERIAALVAVGVVVPLSLLYGIGPVVDHLYPWRAFGETIRDAPAPVWMLQYRAPSLTFYSGDRVELLIDADELQQMLSANGDGWLVIEQRAYEEACDAGLFDDRKARIVQTGGRMLLVRLAPDGQSESARACGAGKG